MRPVLVLLVLALFGPAAAAADKRPATKERNATLVVKHAEDPDDPGRCVAYPLAQWTDVRGYTATGWKTTYVSGSGDTRTASGPMSDNDEIVSGGIRFSAPEGVHWTSMGFSGKDGARRDDCSDMAARYEALYTNPIVVTYAKVPASLAVTLRIKRQKKAGSLLAETTIRNTGSVPATGVQIDRPLAIRPNKRKGCDAGEVLAESTRITGGGPVTLQPGQKVKGVSFTLQEGCPGRARVTASASGTADGAPVYGERTVTHEVGGDGRIVGTIGPVRAWRTSAPYYTGNEALPQDEVRRMRSGVTVRARGDGRTFLAKVDPITGGYTIKIPHKHLGEFLVRVTSQRDVAFTPSVRQVRARRSSAAEAVFTVAYDCDAKPPGMSFAPADGFYSAFHLNADYQCRSRRLKVLADVTFQPGWDAERQVVNCKDGQTLSAPDGRLLSAPIAIGAGGTFTLAPPQSVFQAPGVDARLLDAKKLRVEYRHDPCEVLVLKELESIGRPEVNRE